VVYVGGVEGFSGVNKRGKTSIMDIIKGGSGDFKPLIEPC